MASPSPEQRKIYDEWLAELDGGPPGTRALKGGVRLDEEPLSNLGRAGLAFETGVADTVAGFTGGLGTILEEFNAPGLGKMLVDFARDADKQAEGYREKTGIRPMLEPQDSFLKTLDNLTLNILQGSYQMAASAAATAGGGLAGLGLTSLPLELWGNRQALEAAGVPMDKVIGPAGLTAGQAAIFTAAFQSLLERGGGGEKAILDPSSGSFAEQVFEGGKGEAAEELGQNPATEILVQLATGGQVKTPFWDQIQQYGEAAAQAFPLGALGAAGPAIINNQAAPGPARSSGPVQQFNDRARSAQPLPAAQTVGMVDSGPSQAPVNGGLAEAPVVGAPEPTALVEAPNIHYAREVPAPAGQEIIDEAFERYGVTDDPTAWGFVMPDGRGLDFSKQVPGGGIRPRQGRDTRVSSHAGVAGLKTVPKPQFQDNRLVKDELDLFMEKTGAARVGMVGGAVQMRTAPTAAQARAIAKGLSEVAERDVVLEAVIGPGDTKDITLTPGMITASRIKGFFDQYLKPAEGDIHHAREVPAPPAGREIIWDRGKVSSGVKMRPGETVIEVDPQAITAQMPKSQYFPASQAQMLADAQEYGSPAKQMVERQGRLRNWVDQGKPVALAELGMNSAGKAEFTNGRNRFILARDAGQTSIPVVVPANEVKAFEQAGLVKGDIHHALQVPSEGQGVAEEVAPEVSYGVPQVPVEEPGGYAFNRPVGVEKAPSLKKQIFEADAGAKNHLTMMVDRTVAELADLKQKVEAGEGWAKGIWEKGLGWYNELAPTLRGKMGFLTDVLADSLGGTSPNTNPKLNYQYAREIVSRWSKGDFDQELGRFAKWMDEGKGFAEFPQEWEIKRPDGKTLYGMNGKQAMLALTDPTWRSLTQGKRPKMRTYAGNIAGIPQGATIDLWIGRFLRRLSGRPPLALDAQPSIGGLVLTDNETVGGEYGFGQEVMKRAAKQLDLEPEQVQALAWLMEKRSYEQRGWSPKNGDDILPLVQAEKTQRLVATLGPAIEALEVSNPPVGKAIGNIAAEIIKRPDVVMGMVRPLGAQGAYMEVVVNKGATIEQDVVPIIAQQALDMQAGSAVVSEIMGRDEIDPTADLGAELAFRVPMPEAEAQALADSMGVEATVVPMEDRGQKEALARGIRLVVPQDQESLLTQLMTQYNADDRIGFITPVAVRTLTMEPSNYAQYASKVRQGAVRTVEEDPGAGRSIDLEAEAPGGQRQEGRVLQDQGPGAPIRSSLREDRQVPVEVNRLDDLGEDKKAGLIRDTALSISKLQKFDVIERIPDQLVVKLADKLFARRQLLTKGLPHMAYELLGRYPHDRAPADFHKFQTLREALELAAEQDPANFSMPIKDKDGRYVVPTLKWLPMPEPPASPMQVGEKALTFKQMKQVASYLAEQVIEQPQELGTYGTGKTKVRVRFSKGISYSLSDRAAEKGRILRERNYIEYLSDKAMRENFVIFASSFDETGRRKKEISDDARGVLAHETGHVVTNLFDLTNSKTMKMAGLTAKERALVLREVQLLSKKARPRSWQTTNPDFQRYLLDPDELFADAFATYFLRPAKVKLRAPTFYKLIKKTVALDPEISRYVQFGLYLAALLSSGGLDDDDDKDKEKAA